MGLAMPTGEDSKGESEPFDVRALMADIRRRVAEDVERHKDQHPAFVRSEADFQRAPRKAGELVHSEELRYLNANFGFNSKLNFDTLTSHRGGFVGKLIVKVKRKVLSMLWDSLLRDYFAAEREYNASLVRLLNEMSTYTDARDASNFWELIRKIDVDIGRALERIEQIHDEQMASLRSSERRISNGVGRQANDLVASVAETRAELKGLDTVVRGLEGILTTLRESPAAPKESRIVDGNPTPLPDTSYLLLENRYRGSEEEISRRLEVYPPVFVGASKPVVEIGSGRGELQVLLKRASVPSYGVDLDEAMVRTANLKGVDTRHGDGIAHLRALDDGSIGGLIAIQVVEHLQRATLEEFCRLARSKVARGGRIVFETINPRSVVALSSNYFRDPTHVWPLHPDTLGYMMTLAGLKLVETRELAPVDEGAKLQPIPLGGHLTPRWAQTVELLNRNINQLNTLLYGNQDYCIIAEVP